MTYQLMKELLMKSMKAEFPTYEFTFLQREEPEKAEYLLCNIPSSNHNPALNLTRFYQSVLDNGYHVFPAMLETCKDIIKDGVIDMDYDSLIDFNKVKDRIYCRLIDGRRHPDILTQAFHMPYLDLQVIFYIPIEQKNNKFYCECILKHETLKFWNISAEELFTIAKHNLLSIANPTIISTNTLGILAGQPVDVPEEECSYFVLCEDLKYCSTMLLFPELFEHFSKKLKSDLYLVPISDNELAIERTTRSVSALKSVRDCIPVPDKERLGEHIYSYRQGSLQIGIVLDSAFRY